MDTHANTHFCAFWGFFKGFLKVFLTILSAYEWVHFWKVLSMIASFLCICLFAPVDMSLFASFSMDLAWLGWFFLVTLLIIHNNADCITAEPSKYMDVKFKGIDSAGVCSNKNFTQLTPFFHSQLNFYSMIWNVCLSYPQQEENLDKGNRIRIWATFLQCCNRFFPFYKFLNYFCTNEC